MITLDSFSSLGEAPRALVQDVLGGRAPHAVLITGIAGTGKRTLARLLACCHTIGDLGCHNRNCVINLKGDGLGSRIACLICNIYGCCICTIFCSLTKDVVQCECVILLNICLLDRIT